MSSFLARPAAAQPTDEPQHQAASLFDRGVQEFAEQRYEAAAGSFLAADDMRGSKEALVNALAAAQRGSLPLLSARAAARLLARRDLDEPARASAQAALDRVLPQLARIEVACAPGACTAYLDGEPTRPGLLYALPGSHEVRAEDAQGARAVAQVACNAGALCPITLTLSDPSAPAQPDAEPRAQPADAQPVLAPASAQPARAEPARTALSRAPAEAKPHGRLPLAVFIATASGAALFAGLTTWSGIEAVQARRLYETDTAAYDDDEVRKHARRADAFLAASLVCAGGALATGLWWVDFGARKQAKLTLAPWLRGGLLAEGRF